MTTAAALTAPQLAKLRADKQFSRLGLAFPTAATIYTARVNQTFTTHDLVAQVTIDGGSGTVGNVLPGMTVLVGSSAGAYDVGICRVRAAWTSILAKIGEGSEIAWADELYLTVIDDFQAWAKHVRIVSNVAYMDYDVAYTNQHTAFDPVPIMGQDVIAFLTDDTVTIAFSSASSYVPGDTVSSRLWSVSPSTGVTISSNTAAAPNITFTVAGTYRLSCAITSNGSKTFTGHRTVVIDPPQVDFALDSCGADFEQGYWSFDVTLWDADLSSIRDRQKVILYARDYYQGVEGSIGYTAGRDNIVAQGWIEGETIVHDPAQGVVTFRVTGLADWMSKITGYPAGLESTAGSASAWTNFSGLTVDKALYHLFHWRSTITAITDVTLTGDTRITAKLSSSSNNLLTQAREIASAIIASVLTDRHGRLFSFIEYNLLPVSSRASVPTVMTITAADRTQTLSFQRRIINEFAQVDLSGIVATSGGQGSAIFSLAPGRVFKRLGQAQRIERLALTSQAQANELAGLISARNNNQFPSIPITFAQINRAFDIAPIQRASITLLAADNARGVGYSGNVTPGRIQYQYSVETGILTPTVDFIGETTPDLSTNGDIPVDDTGTFWTPPPFIPPPLPPLPPLPGPLPNAAPRFAFLLTSLGLFYTETLDLDSPVWIGLNEGYSAQDYIDGFRFLDVNQDGRYYVATKRQVYSGSAGWPAYVIKSEAELLLEMPEVGPYFTKYEVWAMGANPASQDEYAFLAGLNYPTSLAWLWTGNSEGTPGKVAASEFASGSGGRISWGATGILATYAARLGTNGAVARFAFDGLTEDYSVNLGGVAGFLGHARDIAGADRILTLVGAGSTVKSTFRVDDGETEESVLEEGVIAGGFDATGLKMLVQIGTSAKSSIDGGQTFDSLPFPGFPLSTANNSIVQCMGTDSYVWAARGNPSLGFPGVFYTADFGTTFITKTGNLHDVAGTNFAIHGLKAFP